MTGNRALRIHHLSRARDAADGGVAMAVGQLLASQQLRGDIETCWSSPQDPGPLAAAVAAFDPQLLHVHGLWRAPNRLARRRTDLPLVLAPHGMLDPWALRQHRWRKRGLWHLFEHHNLQRAGALHALCQPEVEALRRLGLRAPIALIPNGVELPDHTGAAPAPPACLETLAADQKLLLFLGRFHTKKGIQPLLEAWSGLIPEATRHGWSLALVGYGDQGKLARQVTATGLPRLLVTGPVFDTAKEATLRRAQAFVLPSYSEGLPMAALEAMAHGLPCLLSSACNLPEALNAGAALRAEPDAEQLRAAILSLFHLGDADRRSMGTIGRALVRERFSWSQAADQTLALYRWILEGGERPGCLQTLG